MFDRQSHNFMKPFKDFKKSNPRNSTFSLSHYVQGTAQQGKLYPVYVEACIPGDTHSLGSQSAVRLMPMLAPAMTDINVHIHYFFVPYRLLWDNTKDDRWSTFINGGVTGELTPVIPRSLPPFSEDMVGTQSLWNYLGFPPFITDPAQSGFQQSENQYNNLVSRQSDRPTAFPVRAYNLIYNEYYRDQNFIDEVDLDSYTIQRRAWSKDYFTGSLPDRQRGISPVITLSDVKGFVDFGLYSDPNDPNPISTNLFVSSGSMGNVVNSTEGAGVQSSVYGRADLSQIPLFDISTLRLQNQVQEWLELNMRGGSRYTEYLKTHFNANPSDARLQRPEYIGGSKAPIIISEVRQTANLPDSPLGQLGGHGISVTDSHIGRYEVEEWGLIMGIMSIMPEQVYAPQGINRKWSQVSNLDYYDPLFANLSMQPIFNKEIYLSSNPVLNNNDNNEVFAYQGAWDEYRLNQNRVCGDMSHLGTLSYWTQQRSFSSIPAMNKQFIECNPSNEIFAVTDSNFDNFIFTVNNLNIASRPLPAVSDPSLFNGV